MLPGGDWGLCPRHLVMQLRRLQIPVSTAALRFLTLREVATELSVSLDWVRSHKDEFPGLVVLPGGDLRIPQSDVNDLVERSGVGRER